MILIKLLAFLIEVIFLAFFTPICLALYMAFEVFYLLYLITRKIKKQWKKTQF